MPRPPTTMDPYQFTRNLPPGQYCSVGLSSNKRISAEGNESPGGRGNEDKFFTCSAKNDKIQVYIVLDGHDGVKACEFAQKHLPSVFLEDNIHNDSTLTQALKRAFYLTEREFFVRIDPHITRKMTLQLEIDQKARNSAEAVQLYPGQVSEIQSLDEDIRGGTTIVMAVVFNNKLYVANCGDSRAVLCMEDINGKITAKQISVDHNTENEAELTRLAEIGLDPYTLRKYKRLGTQQNTRSIGDYSIKGGYKEIDTIAHAKAEPGIADPYIAPPIDLTRFRGFLLLMTDGLYEAYEAWTHRPAKVNEDIADLVAKEIREMADFDLVAQRVVEMVQTVFRQSCRDERHTGRLDDITLIIRNFGFPNIGHVRSYPSLPVTAPPTSGNQSVFFDRPPPQQVSTYHPSTSSPSLAYQQNYTMSLTNMHYDTRQQPYPNNAQQYNGTGSVEGGSFIPEPSGNPEFHQHPSYQRQIATSANPGYHTNDWPGYSTHEPSSRSQMPYTQEQIHPHHIPLHPSQSYPRTSPHRPRERESSDPNIGATVRPQTNSPQLHQYQNYGPGGGGMRNPNYQWSRDYENTNPLGTEEIQSEHSSSRSMVYENVTLRTQEQSQIALNQYSNSTLEQQTQAMTFEETQSSPSMGRRTPRKHSPSTSQYTPSIDDRKTPVPNEFDVSPTNNLRTTHKMERTNSDLEMYGWTIDGQPSSLNPGPSTLTERSETLPEYPVAENVPVPKVAFTEQSTPPASPSMTQTELVQEEDSGTGVLTVNMDDAVSEPEDTDGDIKAFVKFLGNFPEIGWDEIPI